MINNICMKKLFFKINKHKNTIKKIMNIILLLVSLGIIFYFFIDNNNYLKLLNALPYLNAFWIIMAFFSLIISWYFDSLSIKLISNAISSSVNHRPPSFFKISVCGQYFHAITPLGMGSQPAQILRLSKKNIPKEKAVLILFQKYVIYQTCLFFYSLTCFLIYRHHIEKHYPKIMLMVIMGLICQAVTLMTIKAIFFKKNLIIKTLKIILNLLFKLKIIKDQTIILKIVIKFENKINNIYHTRKKVKKNKVLSMKIWICSFFQITFLFSVPFFIFKSFNHPVNPIFEILCTQSIINTTSSFTPLPGSCGTAEESFLSLFSSIFSSEEITSAMLLSRFITFYSIIAIGYIINNFISKK
ncbi:MAG: YbhN family protein [Acutalibacteraceae bacterium]